MLKTLYDNWCRFIERLKIWLSYWKVTENMYDFDHSSITEVEYHQISRIRDCIQKEKLYEGWEEDVKWMNIALNCLDILRNSDWWDIKTSGSTLEDNIIDLKAEYTFTTYINTRNFKRFFPRNECNYDGRKVNLREAKAFNVYLKIRQYKSLNWWL